MFISFEGGEGCGKSTQAKLLQNTLRDKLTKKVILTREPGGTPLAENLRKLILSEESILDPLTEFLVINAARRDHVVNLIQKSLTEGSVVISDRFIDSSLVYQGYVKGLPLELIEEITKLSIGDFAPTLTFLLDIDPVIALERIKKDREELNHYDKAGIDFHNKIRAGFLNIAKRHSERFRIIDATQSAKIIEREIFNIIMNFNK